MISLELSRLHENQCVMCLSHETGMFTEAEAVWFATSAGNHHLRDTLDRHSDGSNPELLPTDHSVTEARLRTSHGLPSDLTDCPSHSIQTDDPSDRKLSSPPLQIPPGHPTRANRSTAPIRLPHRSEQPGGSVAIIHRNPRLHPIHLNASRTSALVFSGPASNGISPGRRR